MSHNVATTTSSSSATPTQRLKNGNGRLSYAQGSVTQWQRLDDVLGKGGWNVYNCVFDFRLEFCQKNQGNRCTVKYLPGGYAEPKLTNMPNGMIEILFVVTGTPECIFSGDENKAKEFPLAKLFGSFTHVKIEFEWSDFVPKPKNQHECRQILSHLTVFLKQMRNVSEAESTAQEALVGNPISSQAGATPPPTPPAPARARAPVAAPATAPATTPAPAPPITVAIRARAPTIGPPTSPAKSTKQEVDVQVTELEEKIAAVKSENADAMVRRVEEREREMREDEEMIRRKAEKFAADMKKLRAEGESSVGALEEERRRLQG